MICSLDQQCVVILASDGIWDVITNEEAVKLALSTYSAHRKGGLSPFDASKKAAEELVEEALRRASADNLTAVVFFAGVE